MGMVKFYIRKYEESKVISSLLTDLDARNYCWAAEVMRSDAAPVSSAALLVAVPSNMRITLAIIEDQ